MRVFVVAPAIQSIFSTLLCCSASIFRHRAFGGGVVQSETIAICSILLGHENQSVSHKVLVLMGCL